MTRASTFPKLDPVWNEAYESPRPNPVFVGAIRKLETNPISHATAAADHTILELRLPANEVSVGTLLVVTFLNIVSQEPLMALSAGGGGLRLKHLECVMFSLCS
jgi:hypothetical protein